MSTHILRVGEELIVHVSATNAFYTVLKTDEGDTYRGDIVETYHVRFHSNRIRWAKINVTAYGFKSTSQVVYVRLRFSMSSFSQDAQKTYYNSSDYARGYNTTSGLFMDLRGSWDVMWEFMKFGARYNQSVHDALYSGEGLTPQLAIQALLLWSQNYFSHYYQNGLNVSNTAYETFQDFKGFKGETDTYTSFDPGKKYECSSIAAFLSGVGLIMGIPTRMVSLSDYSDRSTSDDDYQHMFAEIYGYEVNGNHGWFLIDPARGSNHVLSSFSNVSEVKFAYSYRDGEVKRLWVIWGITSTGWGKNVIGLNRQTSWVDDVGRMIFKKAPFNSLYSTNLWDISLQETP